MVQRVSYRLPSSTVGALLVLTLACGNAGAFPDPKTLPFKLETLRVTARSVQPIDLDGDGRDEFVYRYQHGPQINSVVLHTNSGNSIDQINYQGSPLEPHFRDIDHDGVLELLVPVLRNDSLFLSIANANGKKLYSFFLIDGKPRQEPEGELPWDPGIVDFIVKDVNQDGVAELVSVVATGFAREPRGVLVHSLPDGRPLWKTLVGAGLQSSFHGDFDGDQREEIVVVTQASKNGADAGGFDDDHAYLIVFELTPSPQVVWSRVLGAEGIPQMVYADFIGGAKRELLVVTAPFFTAKREVIQLELIDPGTWVTLRERTFNEPFTHLATGNLDRDPRPEIVAIRQGGEVLLIDDNFEIINRRHLDPTVSYVESWPDIDGDGLDEIVIYRPRRRGFVLLDSKLRVKAAHASGPVLGVAHNGVGRQPSLLTTADDAAVLLRAVQNPWFWVYRYGPTAAWIVGAGLALALASTFVSLQRRNLRLQAIHGLAVDGAEDGFLLMNRHGRITSINATLRGWLGVNGKLPKPNTIETLQHEAPELAMFCQAGLDDNPPTERKMAGPVRMNGQERDVNVVADPIITKTSGDPHWLVRVSDKNRNETSGDSKTWAMMAQRVAHSLKNPLTSILLTQQRLQMEYRELAPAVANRLDKYSTRIQGRIDELRQLTNNFLKFVDVQAPDLAATNLNELMQEFADSLQRSLPPDIKLHVKLDSHLNRVWLDADQMRSALDNLVANAMNSMPEGGTVTLATHLAERVQLDSSSEIQDYAQVEVLDTGGGISRDAREHLFEPGFSTAKLGSGLGLAIVKKIASDHRGSVMVESEVGVGSAFSMYIPLRPPTTAGSSSESTASGESTP